MPTCKYQLLLWAKHVYPFLQILSAWRYTHFYISRMASELGKNLCFHIDTIGKRAHCGSEVTLIGCPKWQNIDQFGGYAHAESRPHNVLKTLKARCMETSNVPSGIRNESRMDLHKGIKLNKNGRVVPIAVVATATYIFYNIFVYLKVSAT